jgi:hypothetical protein
METSMPLVRLYFEDHTYFKRIFSKNYNYDRKLEVIEGNYAENGLYHLRKDI